MIPCCSGAGIEDPLPGGGRSFHNDAHGVEAELSGSMILEGGSNEAVADCVAADVSGLKHDTEVAPEPSIAVAAVEGVVGAHITMRPAIRLWTCGNGIPTAATRGRFDDGIADKE